MEKTPTDDRMPLIKAFLDRNEKINLSSIRDTQGVWVKHIIDSLIGAEAMEHLFKEGKTLLDVGTGGGFPLLPIAQKFPQIQCTGLDSRKKKMKAVQNIIKDLGLENCDTVRSRVEDHKKQYDIVTARAVSYADQLLEWTLPRVKPGGSLLLWKMYSLEEDADIHEALHDLPGEVVTTHRYNLPNDTLEDDKIRERIIYHIHKPL